MNKLIYTLILVFLFFVFGFATADTVQDKLAQKQSARLLQQARQIIKQYNHQLKKIRKQGLNEGGGAQAVENCHLQAPDIAADLSKTNKWSVRRTTLKTRGLDNAPDKWELTVLEKFARQYAQQPKDNPEFYEIVKDKNGKPVFRYMQAIYIKRACLKCHGSHIDKVVARQLDSLYPFDQATGYKLGDLRGAYTLKYSFE